MTTLTIPVEYNGYVFNPLVEVDLPAGTLCLVHFPALKPPPPVTDEHRRLWDEITRQVEASAPVHPTADGAMEAIRGRA